MVLNSFNITIEDEDILGLQTVTFSDSLTNSAANIQVSCTNKNFPTYSLYNKKVKFYLNYGGKDSVPFFIGYIRDYSSSDDGKFNFRAGDARTFLSGEWSESISLTDAYNFDGHTLAQFLHSYIADNTNKNKTYIGLDMLQDTDKPILLEKLRGVFSPLDIITTHLEKIKNLDKTDDQNIYGYFLEMIPGREVSHITLMKEKSIDLNPTMTFKDNDGINQIRVKQKPTPNVGLGILDDKVIKFKYGSDIDEISKTYDVTGLKTPAEVNEYLIYQITKEQKLGKEITLEAFKGHYLPLGTIIALNSNDDNTNGNHRIVSKNITISNNSCSLSFGLDNKPTELSLF